MRIMKTTLNGCFLSTLTLSLVIGLALPFLGHSFTTTTPKKSLIVSKPSHSRHSIFTTTPKCSHKTHALSMAMKENNVNINRNRKLFGLNSKSSGLRKKNIMTPVLFTSIIKMFKNIMTIFFVASTIFFSSASVKTLPSHASSATAVSSASTTTTRLVSSSTSSLDKIVQNYVEKHMFDDEAYDSFESSYREAYQDSLQSSSTSSGIQEILKQKGLVSDEIISGTAKGTDSTGVLGGIVSSLTSIPKKITKSMTILAEKMGMDPKLARLVVAVSTVTIVPATFLYGALSFGGMFRKGLMSKEKKRYGEMSDLSAIEKDPEDLEDEDDEDEDYDDDDGDGDDDGE